MLPFVPNDDIIVVVDKSFSFLQWLYLFIMPRPPGPPMPPMLLVVLSR